MSRIILLGSLFLPASAMDPLAEQLSGQGHQVAVAETGEQHTAQAVLASYAQSIPSHGPSILVAHSNAGNYVPALLERFTMLSAVFFDAVLPDAQGGLQPVVPAALREELAARVVDGLLPPWTRWWPQPGIEALLAVPGDLGPLHESCPQIALEYLFEQVPVPDQWQGAVSGAYLGLGGGYGQELARAQNWGWPTAALELGHLRMLRAPTPLAAAISNLLGQIGHQ